MVRRSTNASVLLAGALGAASCGGGDSTTIDVLAASSFIDVAVPFEQLLEAELGRNVEFSFGSSGSFLEQIRQGAPASVVITADSATMQRIADAGLVEDVAPIAANELVVVTADTAAGQRVERLSDLAADGLVVVLCAASAPCGAATDMLLDRLSLDVEEASREPNVRATLTKVRLGEADAAIVYLTDAQATPNLRTVRIDDGDNVTVTGQAAVVGNDPGAADVLDVLTGPAGAAILADAGFGAP